MEIYSYHYGAAAGKGIGVRAQSKELENLPLSPFLKNLSSLHALDSSEHRGEKLFYLLERDEYSILGLSYLETPKESGYGYKTPCGLQYILPSVAMKALGHYYGEIVRAVDFKKPESSEPEPLTKFPVDRNFPGSGCRPEALAQIVDGLVKVALSIDGILLIALPKDLKSEYETARAVIGEALDYLPVSLRKNIRFLTGLPVEAGETKCLTGFENAIRLNANVVFCPHQYYRELKSYRSFIGVDTEQSEGQAGAFASYITQSTNPADDLRKISAHWIIIPGKYTYEGLNQVTEDLAKEKAAEEAEAQRRKAQAYAKTKKANRMEACLPNYKINLYAPQRRPDKTSQDIKFPEIGKARENSGIEDYRSRHIPQQTDGRRHDTDIDNSRTSSTIRTSPSTVAQTERVKSTSAPEQYAKEQEEKNRGIFFKWVIPAIAMLSVLLVIILIIPMIGFQSNDSRPETTSLVMRTTVPSDQSETETIKASSTGNEAAFALATATPSKQNSSEGFAVSHTPESTYRFSALSNRPRSSSDSQITSDSTFHNCYAISTGNSLRLREGRGTEYQCIYIIGKQSYLWAVSTEKNEQNEDWTEVYYNGKHGFVMSQFIEYLSPEESQKYDQAQKTPVPQSMYGQ